MSLSLVYYPHPALRKKATLVEDPTALHDIAQFMIEVMYQYNGVGLAANQINFDKRVFVMDTSEERNQPIVFINPVILTSSEELQTLQEGCLSIPGVMAKVTRPKTVLLQFYDLKGVLHQQELNGLDSTCCQHEIDHLDGILYPDRIPFLKQKSLWKEYQNLQKET